MTYRVIDIEAYKAEKEAAHERGRPRIYDEGTVSVSFRVPLSVREAGRRRAAAHKVNMTELLGTFYALFCARPITMTREALADMKRELAEREGRATNVR